MIDFIEGSIAEKNPAYIVINCHGIGYQVHVSLNTFSKIPDSGIIRLLTHQVIREDAQQLYGFYERSERELFRHLISVSGVGPNTARMMLSGLSPDEIRHAIVNNNIAMLQSIKGIGGKSAQRIIVDLKDRIEKEGVVKDELILADNTIQEEALSALVMLGFARNAAQKTIAGILKRRQGSRVSVEDLVKEALKNF